MAEGRARLAKAERKQLRQLEAMDRSWMKYVRCSICRHRFVVNNNAEHKVKFHPSNRIAGKIVCPWCVGRDGKYLIQLRLIAEKIANHEMSYCNAEPEDRPRADCKCLACVAGRVIEAHDSLPTVR